MEISKGPHEPTTEPVHPERRGFLKMGLGAVVAVAASGSLFVYKELTNNHNEQKPPLPPTPDHKEKPYSPEVNLLAQGQDAWGMPGATLRGNELRIAHVGREIVEQDGSEPQANSPINLMSHVEFEGDEVTMAATVDTIRESASVQFYGRPPIIYDEHRFEQGSLRLTIEDGTVYYDYWNGQTNDAQTNETPIGNTDKAEITVHKQGATLTVAVNGQKLFTIPDQGVFAKGNIWFGADSENQGGSARITQLKATGRVRAITMNDLPPFAQDPNGFQALATKNGSRLKIGAAISPGPLAESASDEKYRALAESQFGVWTTENALKFQFVHPQPNTYCFEEAEMLISRAEKCGIDVHGHALDFGSSPPRWLQDVARAHPENLETILSTHIARVVGKFKGRIKTWDVVNEPLAEYDDTADGEGAELRHHIWYKGMGAAHIATALRAAHKADPQAELFINEYGLERDGKRWDFFLQTIDELLAKGVPLHGVGFQAHVYEQGRDDINPDVLRKHIRQLAKRGLKVRISEIDVCKRNTDYQAEQFADTLQVALEEPNVIHYSQWGVTEAYGSTSYIDDEGRKHIGDGLLFDTKGRPLKAAHRVWQMLKNFKQR